MPQKQRTEDLGGRLTADSRREAGLRRTDSLEHPGENLPLPDGAPLPALPQKLRFTQNGKAERERGRQGETGREMERERGRERRRERGRSQRHHSTPQNFNTFLWRSGAQWNLQV